MSVEPARPKVGHRRVSSQPIVGRKDRSAGNAGEKIKPVEERCRAAASRHPRLIESFKHAVGKSGGARATAGKRQRDDHVVVIGLDRGSEFGLDLAGTGSKTLIDRIVLDRRGARRHQGSACYDAPSANQTLQPPPKHLQMVYSDQLLPGKHCQTGAKSKTSLRLMGMAFAPIATHSTTSAAKTPRARPCRIHLPRRSRV